MKKLILLSALYLIFIKISSAQDSTRTHSKWYIKPGVGINVPITPVFNGQITDYLLEFDDHSYYWQVISGGYFFNKKWGVELLIQANSSKSISKRADAREAILFNRYQNQYFIIYDNYDYNNFDPIAGNFQRGYLGIVYKIENKKLYYLPKFFIGTTSFYTNFDRAYLKEKDSNTIFEIAYSPSNTYADRFTIAPAFAFGYRISNSIILNADMIYSYYKSNFEYTEEIKNLYTLEKTNRVISYKKSIHTLSLGIGLVIEIR